MENLHISELIPEYLDGNLDPGSLKTVEGHLKTCPQCREELKETERLFKAMAMEEVPVPTEALGNRFDAALRLEKQAKGKIVNLHAPDQGKGRTFQMLKVAVGIALLFGAFQLGSISQRLTMEGDIALLETHGKELKQTAILSLMENQSASKRIQGMGLIENFDLPDPQVIEALGNRMLHDENDNVRLTAFEALSNFPRSQRVKQLMIQALEQEKNPSLQVSIIQLLVSIQEEQAVPPMKKLLEREDTQPFIKEQIIAVLPSLT